MERQRGLEVELGMKLFRPWACTQGRDRETSRPENTHKL